MEFYGFYRKQYTTNENNKETFHVYFPPSVGSPYIGYKLKRILIQVKTAFAANAHSFSIGYSSNEQPYNPLAQIENGGIFNTRRPSSGTTIYMTGKSVLSSNNLTTTQIGTVNTTGTVTHDVAQAVLDAVPGQSTGPFTQATLPRSLVVRRESGPTNDIINVTIIFEQIES